MFSIQDTLYRVYTYSRDLENGLCDRHKKAEIVSLSETQKQDLNHAKYSYNGELGLLINTGDLDSLSLQTLRCIEEAPSLGWLRRLRRRFRARPC